jgi:hypothetical protein
MKVLSYMYGSFLADNYPSEKRAQDSCISILILYTGKFVKNVKLCTHYINIYQIFRYSVCTLLKIYGLLHSS